MGQPIKPNQTTVLPSKDVLDVPIQDVSIERLIDNGLAILYREIRNLMLLSSNGKLSPEDARDLREHLKVLFELKSRENDLLKGLSDDQLKQLVDQVKNGSKQDSSSTGSPS